MRIRKNGILGFRKGNAVLDTAMVLIMIVVFTIVTFFSYKVYTDVKPMLDDDLDYSMTEINETIDATYNRFPSVFDGLIVFMFIGLWVLVIVASMMIDAHPLFFGVTVLLLAVVIVMGMFLGNFYEETMLDADLSGVSDSFPMTNWILTNMLYIGLAIGFSIAISLYAKSKL